MALYDDIKAGLEEAIAYERGEAKVREKTRTVKMAVAPIPSYTADDIKHIRLSTGLTQRMFAEAMGVSQKAVVAWEAGKNAPAGPAVRMLGFLQSDPNLFDKTQIISR